MSERQSISSLNLFIIFFLSYSFYIVQILTQKLFSSFGKQSIFIICLLQLLFPLTIFIICKIINTPNKKQNSKTKFIYSIISAFYLILTLIITITNITNIVTIYYYQQTNYLILLTIIFTPTLYTIIKNENVFFYLASILLIIYTVFKYAYLSNPSSIDTFIFYNIFDVNKSDILLIIIYSIPIFLEPLLLINNQKTINEKANTKLMVILASIISIVGILTILRQTWEFGELLNKIRFPYLESIKNIVAGKFFENIDFYYLLSISVSLYIRITYTFITIKKSLPLNKLVTIGLLTITLAIVFIIHKNMNLYLFSIDKILIITSSCLIILFLLSIPDFLRRRAT